MTIFFRPLTISDRSFDGTVEQFKVLQDSFGGPRVRLTKSHLPRLDAMAAASGAEFYRQVASTVERTGDIELWQEGAEQ